MQLAPQRFMFLSWFYFPAITILTEVLDSAVVQGVIRRSSKSRQVLLQLLGLLRCRFTFLFIKKLLHHHAYYTVKREDVVHALEGSPSKYKTEELKVTKIMPQATDW